MQDAAGRLALMNMMVVVGPGLAPIIGGLLAGHIGWRLIFLFLTLLGLVSIAYTLWQLPETRPPDATPHHTSALREYAALLRSKEYLGFALGGGFATTSIYAVIAAAPFVFSEQLGRPSQEVGFALALIMAGMVFGNMLARHLLRRISIRHVLLGANALSLLSALCMLGIGLLAGPSVASFVVPAFAFSVAAGLTSPAAATEAISVKPEMAGAASGLYGCGQMLIGAVCTLFAGVGSNHAISAASTLVVASLIGQVMLRNALGKA